MYIKCLLNFYFLITGTNNENVYGYLLKNFNTLKNFLFSFLLINIKICKGKCIGNNEKKKRKKIEKWESGKDSSTQFAHKIGLPCKPVGINHTI